MFAISVPACYYSPRHAVMARIYGGLLDDALAEFSYDAELAGLHYRLSPTAYGFQVSPLFLPSRCFKLPVALTPPLLLLLLLLLLLSCSSSSSLCH